MAGQLLIAGLVYVTLVLQSTIVPELSVGALQPWLPGLTLVAAIRWLKGPAALVCSAVLGLGVDCLSGEGLGVQVVIATLIATILLTMGAQRGSFGLVRAGVWSLIATVLWKVAAATIQGLLDRRPLEIEPVVMSALLDGFATAAITIAIALVGRLMVTSSRTPRTSSPPLANRWSMLTGE